MLAEFDAAQNLLNMLRHEPYGERIPVALDEQDPGLRDALLEDVRIARAEPTVEDAAKALCRNRLGAARLATMRPAAQAWWGDRAAAARGEAEDLGFLGARYLLDPRRKHHPTLVSDEGREKRTDLLLRALARRYEDYQTLLAGRPDADSHRALLATANEMLTLAQSMRGFDAGAELLAGLERCARRARAAVRRADPIVRGRVGCAVRLSPASGGVAGRGGGGLVRRQRRDRRPAGRWRAGSAGGRPQSRSGGGGLRSASERRPLHLRRAGASA
mgnify:CR=1 FL=1